MNNLYQIFKISDNLSTEECKLNIQRVEPVWGNRTTPIEYLNHIAKRINAGESIICPSEVGCSLAHQNIYQEVINSNKPALILEEDIEIDVLKITILNEIIKLNHVDFVHLAAYPGMPFYGKMISKNLYAINYCVNFWGACAYYITPKTARELLEFHNEYIRLADDWGKFFSNSSIKPYYYPIFLHQWRADGIESERYVSPRLSEYKIIKRRIKTFLKIILPGKLKIYLNKKLPEKLN